MLIRPILLVLASIALWINNCHADLVFSPSIPIKMDPFIIIENSYYPYVDIENSECQRQINILKGNACKNTLPLKNAEQIDQEAQACNEDFKLNYAKCRCSIYVNFPKFSSSQFSNNIMNKINNTLEFIAIKYLSGFKGFPKDCPPSIIPINRVFRYYLSHDLKFNLHNSLKQRDNILSIKMINYESYSAVPPIYTEEFYHFNLINGEKIDIKDVIKPQKVGELYEFLFQKLKMDPKTFYYKHYANTFMEAALNNPKVFKVNYFYFSKDKAIIYFSPNEVAPKNAGSVEIAIPNFFLFEKYINEN